MQITHVSSNISVVKLDYKINTNGIWTRDPGVGVAVLIHRAIILYGKLVVSRLYIGSYF